MRKLIVIAAAGGALAIGLPAALAVGNSPETQAPTTFQPVQSTEPQEPPRDRDDCPEKDGNGGETATATPEI